MSSLEQFLSREEGGGYATGDSDINEDPGEENTEDSISDADIDEIARQEQAFADKLLEIQSNDPKTTSWDQYLCPYHEDFPTDVSRLELLGKAFGQSTVVKSFEFLHIFGEEFDENNNGIEVFARSFVKNKSIERLSIDTCDLYEGALFHWLAPFFENNHNLKDIYVSCCTGHGDIRPLCAAIRACTKTSNSIVFRSNNFTDEDLGDFVSSLEEHPQLEKLELKDELIGENVCTELAGLFRRPGFQLKELTLKGNYIGDDGITALSTALATNTSLVTLNVAFATSEGSGDIFSAAGWSALADVVRNPSSSVKELLFEERGGKNDGLVTFCNSLLDSRSLTSLNLFGCRSITTNGFEALAAVIRSPSSRLSALDLGNTGMDDRDLGIISSALAKNSVLMSLALGCNHLITAKGLEELSISLQSPNVKLEELSLNNMGVDDEGIIVLCRGLVNNPSLTKIDLRGFGTFSIAKCEALATVLGSPISKLKELDLSGGRFVDVNDRIDDGMIVLCNGLASNSTLTTLNFYYREMGIKGWDALLRALILCNNTLEHFEGQGRRGRRPSVEVNVNSLLKLNCNANKQCVAVQKAFDYFFLINDFNETPFENMDFPCAVERIGTIWKNEERSETHQLSGLYHVVRNMPMWFELL